MLDSEEPIFRRFAPTEKELKDKLFSQLVLSDLGRVVLAKDIAFNCTVARYIFDAKEKLMMPAIKMPTMPTFIMDKYDSNMHYYNIEFYFEPLNTITTFHIFLLHLEKTTYELTMYAYLGLTQSRMEVVGS